MRKSKVKQFIHLFAGFVLLVHGFNAFEREDMALAIIFISFSILALLVAGIQHWLEGKIRKIGAIFFMQEAFIIYFSAWNYWMSKSKYFALASAIAGTFYIIYSLYLFKAKKRKKYRRSSKQSLVNSTDNLQ